MKRRLLLIPILFTSLWTNASAVTNLPLPGEVFEVNGRSAFVMQPEHPAEGNPWVWYAPTLRNLPNDELRFYCQHLIEHGIAVAGYNLGEVRGAPGSSAQFSLFYDEMIQRGYSEKPVLLGQSRGGLMMLCWAFRNPGKVRAFAGIYPVCNLTSWPLQQTKGSVLADYGMTEEELLQQVDALNPPENLAGLAENRVPLFMVHGDVDEVVPLEENSGRIKEAYEKLGGEVEVKVIPGQGHNGAPEFFQCQDLLDFIFKQTVEEQL